MDKVVGWHHQLNGHEFEETLGDGEGQGILACICFPGRWQERIQRDLAPNSTTDLYSLREARVWSIHQDCPGDRGTRIIKNSSRSWG